MGNKSFSTFKAEEEESLTTLKWSLIVSTSFNSSSSRRLSVLKDCKKCKLIELSLILTLLPYFCCFRF